VSRAGRAFAVLLYYGIARYLPRSYWPGGRAGTAVRMFCARRLCEHVGENAGIEPNVDFGSGRLLRIGARSGIGPRATVGALHIGEDVMIGPELIAIGRNHRFTDLATPAKYQGYVDSRPAVIGDGSWIGARVILLPGVRVGRNCVIGAGAVVTKDVPDACVAAGNPARVIRQRAAPDTSPLEPDVFEQQPVSGS